MKAGRSRKEPIRMSDKLFHKTSDADARESVLSENFIACQYILQE